MRHAMMDKNDKISDEEVVIETEGTDNDDIDLVDEEAQSTDKLKALRDKLKTCEEEKMSHLEELQAAKADFLNAKSRLQQERDNDKKRSVVAHVEKLLPLCDSFYMAMADKKAWDEAPEKWRKGVEGIHGQLQSILAGYNVRSIDPEGEQFDPQKHEALTNIPVDNKDDHHKIMSVVQQGFEMMDSEHVTVVRPARVTVGEFAEGAEDE